MLRDISAVFIADEYDDPVKWMDGWETRRGCGPDKDPATVKLAATCGTSA